MTPALIALALAAAQAAPQSGGDAVQTYAARVALQSADAACDLLNPAERALLDALAARSRDDAARAGDPPDALDRFEARHGAPPQDCDTARADAQPHRDHAAALAATHEIAFPGLHQSWISERRERGAPLWRVRQTANGRPAVLGLHAGPSGDVLTLALRTGAAPAFAVLILRDPARQAAPLDFTAGGLLPAPYADPLSAWGGAAGAQRRIPSRDRLSPETAARLAPADGAAALAFTFPDRAVEALRALAPREGVRVELIGARGELVDTVWFEAGMFNAALAVQALPLPEPDPAPAPAPASR
ncbi:MAG: hypothetical protein ACFE0P_00690 [Oceanicaulis sp.]